MSTCVRPDRANADDPANHKKQLPYETAVPTEMRI